MSDSPQPSSSFPFGTRLLNLSLDDPAQNLALDEALLDQAVEDQARIDRGLAEPASRFLSPQAVLRLWSFASSCVVLGRSSRVADEVHLARCRERGIPILRRASGGGTVVAGPGCLMYTLVLQVPRAGPILDVDRVHNFVLGRLVEVLEPLVQGVRKQGTSDLTWNDAKFSGNCLRLRREHLLYHGTLLHQFPLDLISQCLATPPRQPAYRASRDHASFVTNLPLSESALRSALCRAWGAVDVHFDWPREATERLAREKYSRDEWNFQR